MWRATLPRRPLLAYLFDARNQANTNIGVSMHLKSRMGAMGAFANTVHDGGFQAKLRKAKKNPKGKEAKQILERLMPILQFAGEKSSCWTAFSNSQAIMKITEMSKRFLTPSEFITVSFDDLNNPNAFRLSMRSRSNVSFPAVTSASNPLSTQGRVGIEHLECMASESDLVGEGETPIPCDRKARAQAAMNNPVAYVSECRDMLCDVLVILLGVPPQNFTTVIMDHRQTRKT